MIEVCTVNGYRKSIHPQSISCISELPYREGKSKTVIDLVNGSTVFVDDRYDDVMHQYKVATGQIVVSETEEEEVSDQHPLGEHGIRWEDLR